MHACTHARTRICHPYTGMHTRTGTQIQCMHKCVQPSLQDEEIVRKSTSEVEFLLQELDTGKFETGPAVM